MGKIALILIGLVTYAGVALAQLPAYWATLFMAKSWTDGKHFRMR